MDNYFIKKNGDIQNHKGQVVDKVKKGLVPVVVHKGERIVKQDIAKLKHLEKKYNVKLYPRKK